MEITDIRLTKKGRYSVYIDGEFACVLHPESYLFCGLKCGDTVTPQHLAALEHESLEKLAKERALQLLSGRSYTEKRLYDKLLEHVGDEEISAGAVARMIELGLVDDLGYARRYAADCVNLKGFSQSRTAAALRDRGIGKEIIEQVLDSMEENPQPVIARIIMRKYRRYLDDEKGVKKTVNALQRLGYSFGDIRAVLQNLAEDEAYYDE